METLQRRFLDRGFFLIYLLVFMKMGVFDGSGDTPYLDSKTEDFMEDCFFVLGRLNAGFNTCSYLNT